MSARRLLLPAILLAAGLSVRAVRATPAQDAGVAFVSPAQEIVALEGELSRAWAELGAGCAVACPALAAMERAAARICAIDPGSPCTDARIRTREAARRVQLACGECSDHGGVPGQPQQADKPSADRDAQPPPAPPPPVVPPSGAAVQSGEISVAATRRRGGCAGCVVARDDRDALGASLLAALAGIALLARRRSQGRG